MVLIDPHCFVLFNNKNETKRWGLIRLATYVYYRSISAGLIKNLSGLYIRSIILRTKIYDLRTQPIVIALHKK